MAGPGGKVAKKKYTRRLVILGSVGAVSHMGRKIFQLFHGIVFESTNVIISLFFRNKFTG